MRKIFTIASVAGLLLGAPLPSISKVSTGAIGASYCVSAEGPISRVGIDVIYLNGISNTPEVAMQSRENLWSKVVSKIQSDYTEEITVSNIYNPSAGFLIDTGELEDQEEIENEARTLTETKMGELRSEFPTWPEDIFQKYEKHYYLDRVAELSINRFLISRQGIWDQDGSLQDGGNCSDTNNANECIGSVILKTVATIEERLLAGRRVVLVAHSQGNLFAAAVYPILRKRLATEQLKGLQVVGVAVVSQTTPNGKWVTIAQDKAVYEWYTMPLIPGGNPLGIDNTPRGNFDAVANKKPGEEGTGYPSAENVYTWDKRGHNFIDVYLSDDIFRKGGGSTLREEVKRLVKSAIDDTIAPPKVVTLGPITATLDWIHGTSVAPDNRKTDIDLHVLEKLPDGRTSHVYFSRKMGILGYLDLDDTQGPGPEHYFTLWSGTNCSSLKGVELVFAVDTFALTSPAVDEPIVLNLRVGGQIHSYSTLLKQSESSEVDSATGERIGKTIFALKFSQDDNGTYRITDPY
jgi:hypothetical protein